MVSNDNDDNQSRLHHQQQFEQLLDEYYDEDSPPEIFEIIKQIKLVEEYSLDRNRILCLFSHPEYSMKYMSQNVEGVSGYTVDEIYNGGITLVFKSTYWKQLSLPIKMYQWGARFEKSLESLEHRTNSLIFYCGLKFRTKPGELKTFFVKQRVLSYDENNNPILSYLEGEEISNVFYGDFVWARILASGEGMQHVRAYFSEGKRKEYPDVLSVREIEILKLVAQHKKSAEISDLLGVSVHTVEKHRKNMVARIGVSNMTGLLYLCRLCQLI